ncbi:helix-turn-helix domain-containing protein [Epidermidibacterium keratini]|uniref:Helix-turn-helix domain-containing protein n=1 Tax=Epidermidibacterium keratini TaxID=1891644 RepID=A0A7L4YM03_9ACTN|nr:helix-turn-helix transcriptional regulator [Epidermidibacterium keratini]QHC00082.1 helix-turn-helix domain-containing protein [Epidermidibacterium keratini]
MPQIPSDTRGIVAPGDLVRHVDFQRIPAPLDLAGLVDWFWSVRWDLPMGFTHRQRLVAHPAVNISVGIAPPPGENPPPGPYPLRAVVNGVTTTLTTRALSGSGWNIAAKTTVGGFGAWVDDVAALNDDVRPIDEQLGLDGAALSDGVAGVGLDEGVALLGEALLGVLERRDAQRVSTARQVAEVASVADRDRSVRTVADLAAYAGVTVRTLQRMFGAYAGVSPTWVIRRFRLIDAAELVREGQAVDWSVVATDLGYADQAHLTRDFTATIGQSPAAYAKAQRQDPRQAPAP